jgi:hypothetical protein
MSGRGRGLEEDKFGVVVNPAPCVRSRAGERNSEAQDPDPEIVHIQSIAREPSGSPTKENSPVTRVAERYRKDAQ